MERHLNPNIKMRLWTIYTSAVCVSSIPFKTTMTELTDFMVLPSKKSHNICTLWAVYIQKHILVLDFIW